jgi:hypothetical protein
MRPQTQQTHESKNNPEYQDITARYYSEKDKLSLYMEVGIS